MTPGSIVFFCGYRGHGKNAILEKIKGNNNFEFEVPEEAKWLFSLPSHVPINDMAFATVLKQKIAELLNLEVSEIDALKDEPLPESVKEYKFKIINPQNPQRVTVRDVLIDHAEYERQLDEDYFARIAALTQYKADAFNFVTDFRYPNEFAYFQTFVPASRLFTVRVYRHGVEVPPDDVKSEHSLDDFDTNFLITSIKK